MLFCFLVHQIYEKHSEPESDQITNKTSISEHEHIKTWSKIRLYIGFLYDKAVIAKNDLLSFTDRL